MCCRHLLGLELVPTARSGSLRAQERKKSRKRLAVWCQGVTWPCGTAQICSAIMCVRSTEVRLPGVPTEGHTPWTCRGRPSDLSHTHIHITTRSDSPWPAHPHLPPFSKHFWPLSLLSPEVAPICLGSDFPAPKLGVVSPLLL